MSHSILDESVARILALLDGVATAEYYGPPNTLDDALREAVLALADGPPATWDALRQALTEQGRRVLGRYAHRASMVALRTGDRGHLDAGLLAHALIQQRVPDWRDDLIFFAPYVHVARRLGAEVPALFERAASHAVPDLAAVMRTFGSRTDVTLGAFGWRQVETADGPTFESLTLGGRPTGAVVGERSWHEVNQAMAQALLDWAKEQREVAVTEEGT